MKQVALQDLPSLAERVLARLPQEKPSAALLGLKGELGAGKTTFAQMLARALGVTDTVQSPTYVLMKKYETKHPRFNTFLHIDAYRLEKAEEGAALQLGSLLKDPRTLACIEWPEKLGNMLPVPDLTLSFSSTPADPQLRQVEII